MNGVKWEEVINVNRREIWREFVNWLSFGPLCGVLRMRWQSFGFRKNRKSPDHLVNHKMQTGGTRTSDDGEENDGAEKDRI